MQERRLLSDREESHALRLARSQPESALELQQLIERVRLAAVDAVFNDPRVQGGRSEPVGTGVARGGRPPGCLRCEPQ